MLDVQNPKATIARVRRGAILALAVLAVALAAFTRSPVQVGALLGSGLLMLLNFEGLVSLTNRILGSEQHAPSPLQAAFLLARYALLGIGLCAIVLIPGVGPVPVALGLSVLVIAILLEAILQLFGGVDRRP